MVSTLLLLISPLAAVEPPEWPPKVLPVWPVRFASDTTGEIKLGPSNLLNLAYGGKWFFDWPSNRWRQDMCFKLGVSFCSVSFWDGKAGNFYHFSKDLKKCSYVPAPVPAVTHPDSFANGAYTGRQMVDGRWADSWLVDTHQWIHYNFTLDNDAELNVPLRDCGPITTKPPYIFACTHHKVDLGPTLNASSWEDLFSTLPTDICRPKAVKANGAEEDLSEEFRVEDHDFWWPGALLALQAKRQGVLHV
eukprot:TRINITY_DN90168_c0_g1_i1.p1 TRINITY_DN90168_c0_g1~~TRINITY_DN90168_c0_g1_i1.p1  ORF type:complete len:272 (+),score=29.44 TRINITY_DN90168_c0_g1_i1:73-816(+)